jgi:hypothetical protein
MCKLAFVLAIGLATVISSGCGSDSPTAPTTTDLRGEWSGTICAPSRIVSCAIVLRLDQSGTAISGSWDSTTNGGPVTGTVSGRAVRLDLANPINPTAQETMTLNVRGEVMTGTYGRNDVWLTRVR